MSLFEAILLGIIQGLSEFIPISSTAHLTIAGKLMGITQTVSPEKWTAFIATIQLGTLAAVLAYFAKDLIEMPKSFAKESFGKTKKPFKERSANARMFVYIIVGSLPIAIVGLAFKDVIEGETTKNLSVIASALIAVGLLMGLAEKVSSFKKPYEKINFWDSLIIGFSQCFALIPGASRSGSTITAGLFLGIERAAAAKFSFLLSVPAVFGSGALEFYQSLEYLDSSQTLNLAVATLSAAIAGYASVAFLLNYLKTKTAFLFVYYRIALGALILASLFAKVL